MGEVSPGTGVCHSESGCGEEPSMRTVPACTEDFKLAVETVFDSELQGPALPQCTTPHMHASLQL